MLYEKFFSKIHGSSEKLPEFRVLKIIMNNYNLLYKIELCIEHVCESILKNIEHL